MFLGFGDLLGDPFNGGKKTFDTTMFDIQMDVDRAKSLKSNAALLVAVEPLPPFYADGTSFLAATVRSPIEVLGYYRLLVARPTCIAIADQSTGEIIAVRETG